MQSQNAISFLKDNPKVQEEFMACKAGDTVYVVTEVQVTTSDDKRFDGIIKSAGKMAYKEPKEDEKEESTVEPIDAYGMKPPVLTELNAAPQPQ